MNFRQFLSRFLQSESKISTCAEVEIDGPFILCKADLFGDFFLLISNALGVILRCDSKSALGWAIEMNEPLLSARCRACNFFMDY